MSNDSYYDKKERVKIYHHIISRLVFDARISKNERLNNSKAKKVNEWNRVFIKPGRI